MSKLLVSAAKLEQRLAALQGEEWSSGSEAEDGEDGMIALPKEPAKKDEKKLKRNKKRSADTDGNGMSSVVYIGHIPHGFYEEQMRGFFSQFGDVERVRLSRSKKTGGSKGYGFLEFKDAAVTKIVAESMDQYLLAGKQLVVKQLPHKQLHAKMWDGANQKFKAYPLRKQHAERVNKTKTVAAQNAVNERLCKKERKKRKQLAELGIEYDFPGYSSFLERRGGEVNDPKRPRVDEDEEDDATLARSGKASKKDKDSAPEPSSTKPKTPKAKSTGDAAVSSAKPKTPKAKSAGDAAVSSAKPKTPKAKSAGDAAVSSAKPKTPKAKSAGDAAVSSAKPKTPKAKSEITEETEVRTLKTKAADMKPPKSTTKKAKTGKESIEASQVLPGTPRPSKVPKAQTAVKAALTPKSKDSIKKAKSASKAQ